MRACIIAKDEELETPVVGRVVDMTDPDKVVVRWVLVVVTPSGKTGLPAGLVIEKTDLAADDVVAAEKSFR